MSETKRRCTILGCRYPNNHSTAAHVEHDAYCSHPTDPRIAAADEMAKALETLTEQLGFRPVGAEAKRKRELLIQAGWEAGCTALAAYNALK